MTFPRGGDWSPAFLRGLANWHESLSWNFDSRPKEPQCMADAGKTQVERAISRLAKHIGHGCHSGRSLEMTTRPSYIRDEKRLCRFVHRATQRVRYSCSVERTTVIATGGITLDRVLESRCRTSHVRLSRETSSRFHEAQTRTSWGRRCQRSYALADGPRILATAERYDLAGTFDGRAVRVCGIGTVCAEPSPHSLEHARVLVDALADDAAREGAGMAILFPQPGVANGQRGDFQPIPSTDLTLIVSEPTGDGAPMTMVRGGEERDLAAIVAMGRARAGRLRFHLDRDVDFVQYAITTRRWLAGLGSENARELHFLIAEEGMTAAAYVIVSVVVGNRWTLEECGDRDPSGSGVGVLLQALLARSPEQRRPTIRAWLPPGFLPPQVTIVSAVTSTDVVSVRMLGAWPTGAPLSSDDVLFWRNDIL
jgi:hypothetical protein